MTEAATLILAPSEDAAPGSPTAGTMLLGLPLVRRAALSAGRAGFDRVYVLMREGEPPNGLLEGTLAGPFPRDGNDRSLLPGRIVLLPDRVAASPQWLRGVLDAPADSGLLYRFGSGAIVRTRDPAPLARALARHTSLSSVVAEWAAALPQAEAPTSGALRPPLEVTSAARLAEAEAALLRSLAKKEDGLLTKLISRRVSLAVTRRLAGTRVTPNMMTLVCLGLGLAAASAFASPSLPRQILGGALFLLHSILDGCDGELARLKFQESRAGGVLDFFGDNTVHVAVFSAFAVAWSRAANATWPLILGAFAVGGTILCAAFIYLYAMRPRAGGGPILTTVSPSRRSRLTRILDELARRDFIYLVMVLALFGRAYWFLAPTAVGTPLFFLALLVMALGGRRSAVAAQ